METLFGYAVGVANRENESQALILNIDVFPFPRKWSLLRRLCSHSASWHRSPRHLLSILSCPCGRIFLCSLLFWHSYGACLWLASLFKLQICVQHHSWALLLPELIRVLQVTAFMKMFLLFCTKYPIPWLLARILLSALSPKALRHQ